MRRHHNKFERHFSLVAMFFSNIKIHFLETANSLKRNTKYLNNSKNRLIQQT